MKLKCNDVKLRHPLLWSSHPCFIPQEYELGQPISPSAVAPDQCVPPYDRQRLRNISHQSVELAAHRSLMHNDVSESLEGLTALVDWI